MPNVNKEMGVKTPVSFYFFLCSFLSFGGAFGAAWYLSSIQADPKYAFYLAIICLASFAFSIAGFTIAWSYDRKLPVRKGLWILGSWGNLLLILLFIGLVVLSFFHRH